MEKVTGSATRAENLNETAIYVPEADIDFPSYCQSPQPVTGCPHWDTVMISVLLLGESWIVCNGLAMYLVHLLPQVFWRTGFYRWAILCGGRS